MDAPRLEPGTVLAGKYRLGQRLGEGGMGTVYRAEHLVLKAQVAVKVIDREVVEGDVTLARFMREAQAAASLRSPHVVQIIDYGMEGARPFMVMELLEGETLAARIERSGQLTPHETYRVMSHVARAVSKAHEAGIVHRDLKPDNVFLVHNEGDEIAKVLDFGVAKMETTSLGGHSHTRTGSLLGTPYYMSPEQAQGNKEIDFRSDLWALGVIAFECLLGRRPFSSEGLGDLVIQICIRDIPVPSSMGTVPAGFDAWFAHAVAREPDGRFQSARELHETLRDALGIPRETGSIPESAWSLPAAVPARAAASQAAAQPGALPAAGVGSSRLPATPDNNGVTSATRADVISAVRVDGETLSDVEVPRGSQWAVVPRGAARDGTRPTVVSDPPPATSGFWGIVGVAFLALALGGGAVFLLREAGIPIPGLEAARRAVGPVQRSGGDGEPAAVDGGASEGTKDTRKSPTKQHGSASASGGAAGISPATSTGGSGAEVPGGGDGVSGPVAEPTESEILDAVDAAAARLTGEQKPGDATKPPPTGSGGATAAPPSIGPKPELPEGLKPAPAPPPPAP